MNRLGYNKILETLGINNPIKNIVGKCGTREVVHFWNDVEIHFNDCYYTVISGKIPLEVANIIYDKYPNNPYKIRVDGGLESNIPVEHSIEDRNGNKYIRLYHIDSKEGLVIFLTELSDYYARKQGLPETEVKRYDEIMAIVCEKTLKEVEPNITTYDWMKDYVQYGNLFFDTVNRDNGNPFGKILREVIDHFDRVVNPYTNKDIEFDSIANYLKKVNINVNNNFTGKKSCIFLITTKDGIGRVSFYRGVDGFVYRLDYDLGLEDHFAVVHYFSSEEVIDNGEYIYITYNGKCYKQEIHLTYNITSGLATEVYETKCKKPITYEQLIFIYNELVKAIQIATTITIDNMRKKGISKKLDKDEKGKDKS